MESATAATSMARSCCTASALRKPLSRWSSTWKRRATNWSAWRLPRLLSKTFSSNLPEGGYAIELPRNVDAHPRAPRAAQQNVFLFQRDHAIRIFFALLRRIRQRRSHQSEVLPRPGLGAERDGQFLGTQRHAGHVPRTRHPAPLSRHAGNRNRHARLQRVGELLAHTSRRVRGTSWRALPVPRP